MTPCEYGGWRAPHLAGAWALQLDVRGGLLVDPGGGASGAFRPYLEVRRLAGRRLFEPPLSSHVLRGRRLPDGRWEFRGLAEGTVLRLLGSGPDGRPLDREVRITGSGTQLLGL